MHENSIMTYGFMDHSLAITHLLWMGSHSEVSKVNFQLRCDLNCLVSAVFIKYRLLRRLVSPFLLEILAFCSKSYHFLFFLKFSQIFADFSVYIAAFSNIINFVIFFPGKIVLLPHRLDQYSHFTFFEYKRTNRHPDKKVYYI